jgi:hypothetical protein
VFFSPGQTHDAQLAKKAIQTISRARKAGGMTRPASQDPAPFLRLYERASEKWSMQYPRAVLEQLARTGLLKFYDVEFDGSIEASAAALVGDAHWMYWLAAQSDAGRAAELGYMALAALIADAHASGAAAVNLGASAGLPGVAQFKRRFGGIDTPVIEHRSTAMALRAAQAVFGSRVLTRLRRGAPAVRPARTTRTGE